MDAVKAFNAELSALYEEPPPITKAKMNAITKGAIKAIKFYKHVVQSVEKFILKCKPEYKVPGLYVIDSIVRQSRHQFGADKDVFARRFSKNMQNTFLNLFRCPPEDKSKVIRVLNLWQKNDVFAPDIIQPLFDLADPNNPIHKEAAASANAIRTPTTIGKSGNKHSTDPDCSSPLHASQANAVLGSNQQLQLHLQQLQQLLLRQRDSPSKGPPGTGIPNKGIRNEQFKFDKKLLDYDYSEEEDEGNCSPKGVIENNLGRILSNPDVMRQLQTLQAQMTAQQVSTAQNFLKQTEFEETKRKLLEFEMMKQQEEEFDKHLAHLAPTVNYLEWLIFHLRLCHLLVQI